MASRHEQWNTESLDALARRMKSMNGSKLSKFNSLQSFSSSYVDEFNLTTANNPLHLDLNGNTITKEYFLNDVTHITDPPAYQHEWTPDPVLGYPDSQKAPNYLFNFEVRDVVTNIQNLKDQGIEKTNPTLFSFMFAYDVFRSCTHQTRISHIYDVLLAWICTAAAENVKCYSVLLIHLLLKDYKQLPFNPNQDGHSVYTDGERVSSMLPLVLYYCCASIQARVTGVITEYEELLSLNQCLEWAKEEMQTSYLNHKGIFRDWITAIHEPSCGQTRTVPLWNVFGMFCGISKVNYMKILKPNQISDFIAKVRKTPILPEMVDYLLELSKPKHPYVFHLRAGATRHMSNPGSYFETSVVLALEDAIGAKVHKPVMGAIKKRAIMVLDSSPPLIIEPEYPPSSPFHRMWKVFLRLKDRTVKGVKPVFFQAALMDMWSSKSSGEDLNPDIAAAAKSEDMADEFIRRARARNVSYALNALRYETWTYIVSVAMMYIAIAVRSQLIRKMRVVAGVNNPKSAAGFAIQKVLKVMTAVGGYSSSGKQRGNYRDMLPLLQSTSFGANAMVESSDVAGMDASLQEPNTEFVNAMACNVLSELDSGQPYLASKASRVIEWTYINGSRFSQIWRKICAPLHFVAMMYGAPMTRATTVQTTGVPQTGPEVRIIGKAAKVHKELTIVIVNNNQTFPSGLPQTSDHHTADLGVAILSAKDEFVERYHKPPPLADQSGMGDDLRLVLYGTEEDINNFMEIVYRIMADLGLSIKAASSTRFGEFLQQAAYEGRVLSYADRIQLSVTERPNYSATPVEKQNELMALIYDLGNRVPNPNALVTYAQNLWFVSYGALRISGFVNDDCLTFTTSEFARRCFATILLRRSPKDGKPLEIIINAEDNTPEQIRAVMLPYKNVDGVRVVVTLFPPMHAFCLWSSSGIPPNATVCADGRVLPQATYYTPNGRVYEWWKFQVGMHEKNFYNTSELGEDFRHKSAPELLLDVDYCKAMKLDISHALTTLLKKNRLEALRAESRDEKFMKTLSILASRMRAKRDAGLVSSSIAAANLLVSKYDVVVPDSFLYGARDRYRLQATVTEGSQLKSEGFILRERAFRDLNALAKIEGVSSITELKGNNAKMMLFMIDLVKNDVLTTTPGKHLAQAMFLSSEIRSKSMGGALWARIRNNGTADDSSKRAALLLAESYSPWKLTERALDWAKREPALLRSDEARELFCSAIGASVEQKEALYEAIFEDEVLLNSRFNVSVPPRQQFLHSGHPLLPVNSYVDLTSATTSTVASGFNSVVCYAVLAMFAQHAQSHIPVIRRHHLLSNLLSTTVI